MSDQNPHVPIPKSSLDSIFETGNMSIPSEVGDSNIPITLQKGVRSCTQHPISNFVSYHALSSSFRNYVVSLSSVIIIRRVSKALAQPQWRTAMEEEMKLYKKTVHGN